eukprot:TRINITY_DN1219_c0_g1_i1.p1 TRINITY_DN1219_c0_g1~~TRINITY_DN1219_c0_g1_i1.p1  ORF type:complete len:548 (-),score=169.45 TRINITY_DN1219_c0_g1_i1:281-1924(-)
MQSPSESHPPLGYTVLKTPTLNKGLGFTPEEREKHGLKGLLPPGYLNLDAQVLLAMEQLRLKKSDIEKYIYLQSLQDINETLYYALLGRHTYECMPLVYTPTVGEACQKFSHLYRQTPRGLYISIKDKGNVRELLDNWPHKDIKAIVFTDGERILGLGDQGIDGMGIPVGKLALYTACAGVHPLNCLPVTLDVGTNNQDKINDPFYMGLRQPRVTGQEYDDFVKEFMEAAIDAYGRQVMLQFEDFGNSNAFRLLHDWQPKACCFNDDIQGTASVVLGGLLASERITGVELKDRKVLFLGAGEAGVGIANLIAYAIQQETGDPIEKCRENIFLLDSKGLVVKSRIPELQHHKLLYAHDVPTAPDLISAIKVIKPSILIGVSTIPKSFNQEVIETMSSMTERPIIFALSNPTSKAECTPMEAYQWSNGKAIYASGSPFEPVEYQGKTYIPGQGNNAYIFPGIGLGALAAGSTAITDHDMFIAAKALALQVPQERLDASCTYPHLKDIRQVSLGIAVAVADNAHLTGTASAPKPDNMEAHVRSLMYEPQY